MTTPFLSDITDDALNAILEGRGQVSDPAPNEAVKPNPVDDHGESSDEVKRKQIAAVLGPDCPLAMPKASDPNSEKLQWAAWGRSQWMDRAASVQMHLWYVQRNRLYRAGRQWVSSRTGGPWREPARSVDTVRAVYNLFGPALDYRLNVLCDQKPGFRVNPASEDGDDKQKAEAQQAALDAQWQSQDMDRLRKEAAYWAQTDGVSFIEQFWNPDKGAWDELLGENGEKQPMGDMDARVLRCDQVRVSPEATATVPPKWLIIRDIIPVSQAVALYGQAGYQAAGTDTDVNRATTTYPDAMGIWSLRDTNIGDADRVRSTETTERFTVYVDKIPGLVDQGIQLVIVGNVCVVGPTELMFGVIPVARVPDGSSDPSYFPRPICEQWVDTQQRINALVSMTYENLRVNKGGRFIARAGTVQKETFLGGVTSIIEVSGAINPSEALVPINGFSIGGDAEKMLQLEINAFEQLSGFNEAARGQFSSDTSGRAILAQREALERIFTPPINAMSDALMDWAKIALAGMAWGYDMPRALGTVGKGRPDLARLIVQSTDFDGVPDVIIEPETMYPMPRALRLFLMDDLFQKGLLDGKEYRRRYPFATTKNLESPDEDQEARAERVADAILLGQPVPEMRWQDNEAIHQDILERRVLLRDDVDPNAIQMANERWMQLAQQSAQKNGQMPRQNPQGESPAPSPDATGDSAFAPSPTTQPTQGGPMAFSPPTLNAADQAANSFEATQPMQ